MSEGLYEHPVRFGLPLKRDSVELRVTVRARELEVEALVGGMVSQRVILYHPDTSMGRRYGHATLDPLHAELLAGVAERTVLREAALSIVWQALWRHVLTAHPGWDGGAFLHRVAPRSAEWYAKTARAMPGLLAGPWGLDYSQPPPTIEGGP